MNKLGFSLYKRYSKKKLLIKIFILCSIVIMVSLLSLSFVITSHLLQTSKQKELDINKQVINNINNYFTEKRITTTNILKQIYGNSDLIADLVRFLSLDSADYWTYRIDNFVENSSNSSTSFTNYVNSFYFHDADISNIILYSKKKNFFFITSDEFASKYCIYGSEANSLKKKMLGGKDEGYKGVLTNMPADGSSKNLFGVASDIKDPDTLDYVGQIIISYDTKGIDRLYNQYKDDIKGYLLVLTKDGDVIYDSSNRYYGEKYPYFNKLFGSSEIHMLDKKSYVNIESSSDYGVFIAGILLVYFGIAIFSRRTKGIMDAMEELQKGNLSVRIQDDGHGDELSLIAKSFNNMCSSLEDYIQKVYLSEIKQKNAELAALQSQINPHFLYNTLEVIRMRAVSTGMNDVGDMIYILSRLFHNSVNQETIVTVSDEIDQCRLYLQLFCIRYVDKFSYTINVSDDILNYSIPKFSLQPIIENYIIHGIDMDSSDNKVVVKGFKDKENIVFIIEDNGTGIDEEKLDTIKNALEEPDKYPSSSIGLSNVNERLRLIYGHQYGLSIESKTGRDSGTSVFIKIPALLKEDLIINDEGILSRR